MKIKTKLILIIILMMMFIMTLSTYNTISFFEEHLNNHLKELKKEFYTTKKEELINYSDMAEKVITSYYERTKKSKIQKELRAYIDEQSDFLFSILNATYNNYKTKLPKEQLQQLLLSIIQNTRYGTSGYFWVNDFNYKMIMHPIKVNYTGKYFKHNSKVPFVQLGVDKLNTTHKNKAYIQYSFYSPKSKHYEEKASVVKVFKPYNWVIGTGAYIDDLTQKMQKEALNAIKNMKYGKNGYFWINDMNNKMLMHPIKPEYDNKYFINTPKVPFVELGVNKLQETKEMKTFINYSFYTPATKEYSHKLSIVQKFTPWGWVIGTGVYTDYLDKKIAYEQKMAQKSIEEKVYDITLKSLFLLIIAVVSMILLMNKVIIKPLDEFQQGLLEFFNYLDDKTSSIKKLHNNSHDEIGVMSQKTNKAIASAINTHKELLTLRAQLEKQVELTTKDLHKTQEEFQLATQDKNESLAYGALIQASILPEEEILKNVFSNHFILEVKKNSINSKLSFFEEIRNNEYLYIIIDSNKTDIYSVFITMLLNAIIKQAISKLQHEENINSAWILEFINNNMEHSEEGFDGAVIYYNKNTNTIQYSGANIPLHYYQDDTIHIIQADTQKLALSKNTHYTQHIVDIKRYSEFYISTHNYIRECVDVYNFDSPFVSEHNLFEENLKNMDEDILVVGLQIDNTPQIFIEFEGKFLQKDVNLYMETIEDKIENIGLMSNVSTVFIEQYQNILNYAKSRDKDNQDTTSLGYIKLQKDPDNSYCIVTKNIVSLEDKQRIEPELFEISSLDKAGIKKRYRELRKSGENTHKKGGGVGFYEIAKRCKDLQYNFQQINEERFEFELISCLESSKGRVN